VRGGWLGGHLRRLNLHELNLHCQRVLLGQVHDGRAKIHTLKCLETVRKFVGERMAKHILETLVPSLLPILQPLDGKEVEAEHLDSYLLDLASNLKVAIASSVDDCQQMLKFELKRYLHAKVAVSKPFDAVEEMTTEVYWQGPGPASVLTEALFRTSISLPPRADHAELEWHKKLVDSTLAPVVQLAHFPEYVEAVIGQVLPRYGAAASRMLSAANEIVDSLVKPESPYLSFEPELVTDANFVNIVVRWVGTSKTTIKARLINRLTAALMRYMYPDINQLTLPPLSRFPEQQSVVEQRKQLDQSLCRVQSAARELVAVLDVEEHNPLSVRVTKLREQYGLPVHIQSECPSSASHPSAQPA